MKLPFRPHQLLIAAAILVSLAFHRLWFYSEIKGGHSWRQMQTMLNIRNFYRHDANILNPRINHFNGGADNIFRSEFPLMQWGIAMVMKLTGEHLLVVRLCVWLICLCGVWGFFKLLKQLEFDDWLAGVGAVLMLFAPIVHNYLMAPIPDLMAFSASIWYLYFMLRYDQQRSKWTLLLPAALLLLIATLVKLQYLMYSVVSIGVFLRAWRAEKGLTFRNFVGAFIQLLVVTPALAWYAWVMPTWQGNPILSGIFGTDMPWGHLLGILWVYVYKNFPLIMLTPILAPPFFIGFSHIRKLPGGRWWIDTLMVITLVYLLLQLNAIRSYHDYYLLPFLPWMYVVAMVGVRRLVEKAGERRNWVTGSIMPLALAGAVIVMTPQWRVEKSGYNPNLYHYQQALKQVAPDNERCIMINDESNVHFPYMLDKQGFIFRNNDLPSLWIEDMIKNYGARYLYSDSRIVDEREDVQPFLDTMLLEADNIRVFKLKLPQ